MAKRPRTNAPSLGFALIAKDAQHTLGACLDSIRPYCQQIVVGVDTYTTDRTAKVAKEHGADVVVPVQVSDWHECPDHGRVLAQHFARARNESFKQLDPSLEWIAWIDSDDVLKGGEHLAEFLAGLDERVIGTWHKYHYATVNNGAQTNTLFHRERILRQRVGWDWKYRVHEVVAPTRQGAWVLNDSIEWFHQEGAHKSDNSAARNLLLLEIDLEEDPDDTRAIFYVGNQYFAMGEFQRAALWYERLLDHPQAKNPYERWQSAVYCSIAYERLGDLTGAVQAAHVALDENPTHPEPYFRLASAALLAGEFEKCEFWTKLGRERERPPFFVFTNPLDYSFNNYVTLGDAYAQQGRIAEAKAELEQAYATLPDAKVGAAIAHYTDVEKAVQQGEDFKRFAFYAGDYADMLLHRYEQLPEDVKSIRSVRDVVMPAVLKSRPNTQPRIVFWCGRSFEEWYPGTLDSTGIGGSETAVIEISRRFASAGWRVDVYNGAGRYEGLYDGVGYWEPERYQSQPAEVLVSWRQPQIPIQMDFGTKLVLWCHDLNYGALGGDDPLAHFDKVLGVSQWHADMLRGYYGVDADYVPNGVSPSRFTDVPKVPFRMVYASSPDRGLERLLRLWPRVLQTEPGATLRVAYGFENMDKLIAAGRGDLAMFKDRIMRLMQQPGIEYLGRLPQDQLARVYGEAAIWAFPTHFLEVSCISAMEAMAAGAVPVTSTAGALRETIGDAGMLVDGPVHSSRWEDFYLSVLMGTMGDPQVRNPLMYRGRMRAASFTWDAAFAKWQTVVEGLLSGHVTPRLAVDNSADVAVVQPVLGG